MDIKTEFLEKKFDMDVCLTQPKSFKSKRWWKCENFYGLKQVSQRLLNSDWWIKRVYEESEWTLYKEMDEYSS